MSMRYATWWVAGLAVAIPVMAQEPTPLRQSRLTAPSARPVPFSAEDAAHDDRWIGLEAKDPRWAIDGSGVFFRWNRRPAVGQDPQGDPWFFASPDGRSARELPRGAPVPARTPSVGGNGAVVAWADGRSLLIHRRGDTGPGGRVVATLGAALREVSVSSDGGLVQFSMGEDRYGYEVESGRLRQLTRRHLVSGPPRSAVRWLREQQRELFARIRDAESIRGQAVARSTADAPQAIPVPAGVELEQVQVAPNGRFVTFVARTVVTPRPVTSYLDYVTASGFAEHKLSRAKVGEPQDQLRLGMVAVDPSVDPDSVAVTWIDLPEAGGRPTFPHGPYWSLDGRRAVVQFAGADWQSLWIAELDPATGRTKLLTQERDSAWLGGPAVVSSRGEPALLAWLPDGRVVFASERTGWSHLYSIEPNGTVRALTSGPWEVRGAELSRDRSTWLLSTSRDHASDDHLYLMPAAGGELTRLTVEPGRHVGALSPDGRRVAELFGDATSLPDLFVRDATPGAPAVRVTVSGTDEFFRRRFVKPEIVSVPHPDGKPVWFAVYRPARPNPERAAVVHVHGGGYRHFTHHGWSVYGYGLHVGMIHHLLDQGYVVMDFDYRGGAGYGRDYRTDIYRSMGQKDIDGVIPAIDYLVSRHGVDRRRVGVYGVSYGGFFTLMALFRHPGLFAAGIANAAVTDWAHYSHEWTAPILGVPADDPAPYRLSSPIYHTRGLADPLLITHGLVDDNVEFQDAARLVQKLIEEGKSFESMYYPTEPHTIQTEASRLDYTRRAMAFFDRHLRGKR